MDKAPRFMANNFINPETCELTASSALPGFPVDNLISENRNKFWRTAGHFRISPANNRIYINDGSPKAGTLTSGSYTYATLASHIQAVLNGISSNWTCTYGFISETYRFTINRTSGTAELELSNTTDAVWEAIGFTTSLDLDTAPFLADEPRNHTYERLVMDCLVPVQPTFFGMIGAHGEPFPLSTSAQVRLMGNGVNLWDSPDFEVTISPESLGAFRFLDDDLLTSYRFWAFDIIDKTNPIGPEGFAFAHGYLGDHISMAGTGIAPGYSMTWEDLSQEMRSESGVVYFAERKKYRKFSSLNANLMEAPDRRAFQRLAFLRGITKPFFVSLDPCKCLSDNLSEYTFFARWLSSPDFQHVIRDYYDMRFELVEVI